jgi:hypothetical protein
MNLIKLEKNSLVLVIQVEKKHHLVFWAVVCKTKSQDGLRVLDLKIMNTALLAKWMVRYSDPLIKRQ